MYKRLLLEHREFLALNVYVALCYSKLDYYDVSLEILAVYLQQHLDSAVAVNLKACNLFKLYTGKAAEAELKVGLAAVCGAQHLGCPARAAQGAQAEGAGAQRKRGAAAVHLLVRGCRVGRLLKLSAKIERCCKAWVHVMLVAAPSRL